MKVDKSLLLFSRPVVSDSLRPHELQPARPPCPSPFPGVCPSSCSFHQWGCLAILSSDVSSPSASIFPRIRDFSNESFVCIRWWKYWSFSFSISPSSVYPGLISFRIDWFDLLAVQGTLRSLLRHHSSEASVLWHSAFFGCCYISFVFILTHRVSLFLDLIPFAKWNGWGDVRGRLSAWWEWMEAWTVKRSSRRSLVFQESTVSDAPDFWGWWVSN